MKLRKDRVRFVCILFFFQADYGIRDAQESRGLGDVYKRQVGQQDINSDEYLDAPYMCIVNRFFKALAVKVVSVRPGIEFISAQINSISTTFNSSS